MLRYDEEFMQGLAGAVEDKEHDVVEVYLKKGVSASYKDKNKNSLFHKAIINNDPQMIQLLLKYGVKPTFINNAGQRPITFAAAEGKWECVSAFTAINDTYGKYDFNKALVYTVDANLYELSEALLKSRAKAHYYISEEKYDVVHLAVKHNNLAMLRLLLEYGVPVDHCSSNDKTPLQLAAMQHKWACVYALLQVKRARDPARLGQVLLLCVKEKQFELATIVLKAGASFRWHSLPDINTALHWAVINDSPYMVARLVEHKAPWMKNANEMTPYLWAKQLGRKECELAFIDPKTYRKYVALQRRKEEELGLMILLASHRNGSNLTVSNPLEADNFSIFSLLPPEVLAMILEFAYQKTKPNAFYDLEKAMKRLEINATKTFCVAYNAYGFLRKPAQSTASTKLVGDLSTLTREPIPLEAKYIQIRGKIDTFIAEKNGKKSRAVDLLKRYGLLANPENNRLEEVTVVSDEIKKDSHPSSSGIASSH